MFGKARRKDSQRRGGSRRRGGLLAFALLPAALAFVPARTPEPPWTVFLAGDADGALAPCGCTSPQQGGLKRRATVLREGGERHVLLDNGGLGGGIGVQNRMKAETTAIALDKLGVDAANFAARDAALGPGVALQLARLSGGRLVSTSLRASGTAPFSPWREAGPFLIGGATARPEALGRDLRESALRPEEAAHRLAQAAEGQARVPIMLFDGDRAAARALARAEPALRLVTYRATGRPPVDLEREGDCALATPGERGKDVVRLTWQDGRFAASLIVPLGPSVQDDPETTGLYRQYLRRVSRSTLLEDSPHDAKGFVGTSRCGSCHASALAVWGKTGHAHALKTLETVGHDRDPDCVRCHVVGTKAATIAFASRLKTPGLANVGCESCHGAGAAHAAAPKRARLPKVGVRACLPCHDPENSPHFDFATYWPKIRHGK